MSLLFAVSLVSCGAMGSFAQGFSQGYSQTSQSSQSSQSKTQGSSKRDLCKEKGFRLIGNYNGADACHKACRNAGYKESCRNTTNISNTACYCK